MASGIPNWVQLGLPSIDYPFGVRLWPIFDHVFTQLKGYRPTDFEFIAGKTPMATFAECALGLVTYYTIIFGGRELMKSRAPFKLDTLFKIHNFTLTLMSLVLMVLFIEQLTPTILKGGLYHAVCEHSGGWTDELIILYYMNYLTKYYEFVDTLFLVLRKKELKFLHTYHHGATALLCWTQLVGHTAVSWVPITLNVAVHVVMYWYYFQAARGVKIWWKRYITIFQIVQFVIDLGFVYFASYTYFTHTYFPYLPNVGSCAGEEFAAFAGMAILSSYLLLFISFYLATYRKPVPKKRGRATSALIEMKDEPIPSVGSVKGTANGNSNGFANGHSHSNGHANGNGKAVRSRKD